MRSLMTGLVVEQSVNVSVNANVNMVIIHPTFPELSPDYEGTCSHRVKVPCYSTFHEVECEGSFLGILR